MRGASSGGAARHGWQEHRHRAQACKFCARVMSCLSRRRFQLAIEQRSSSALRGHECVRLHRNTRGLARAMVGSLSPPNRANRCLTRKTPVATRLILAAQPGSDEREEPVCGRYFKYRPPLGSSVLPFRGTPGRRRALAAVPSLQPRRASPYCVLLPPRSSCAWCGVTIVGGEGPTAVGLGARQHDRWHGMDGRHGKRWAGRPPWNPAGFCSCCRGAPRITPSVLVGRSAVYGFRRPCRPRRQDGVPERPRRNTRR